MLETGRFEAGSLCIFTSKRHVIIFIEFGKNLKKLFQWIFLLKKSDEPSKKQFSSIFLPIFWKLHKTLQNKLLKNSKNFC